MFSKALHLNHLFFLLFLKYFSNELSQDFYTYQTCDQKSTQQLIGTSISLKSCVRQHCTSRKQDRYKAIASTNIINTNTNLKKKLS